MQGILKSTFLNLIKAYILESKSRLLQSIYLCIPLFCCSIFTLKCCAFSLLPLSNSYLVCSYFTDFWFSIQNIYTILRYCYRFDHLKWFLLDCVIYNNTVITVTATLPLLTEVQFFFLSDIFLLIVNSK